MTLNLIQGKQINVTLTGSFSGSFTGNLVGSASFATSASFSNTAVSSSVSSNSISASYSTSALQALSSSYSVSSLTAVSSSFSISGSYSVSSSYTTTAISSSHAITASYLNPLSQNISISGSINNVDYVDFNTGSTVTQPVPGRLSWNGTDGTLDIGLKGNNVTLQVGQEQLVRIVNKTGGNLLEAEYRVVRVRSVAEGGAQGQRLAVVLAQADNDTNSATTLGIVTENINANQEGFVTTSGIVRGVNTTGALQGETWVDGDVLYLSPNTPGYLTNTKPTAPQHAIVMGYVVYAHSTQGKIFVKVDNGYELDELHNVLINTGSLATGQLLVRSGSVWVNSTQLPGSYSVTGSLSASSFTGSFSGTASFAISSSFASTASFVPDYVPNNATSSFVQNSQTSSMTVLSASFADVTSSLGYIPENISNKENTTLDNSTSKYPTNNLVKTAVNNVKQLTDLQIRRGGYLYFDDFYGTVVNYPFARTFLLGGGGGLTNLSNGVYRINSGTNANSGGNVLLNNSALISPLGLINGLRYDVYITFPTLDSSTTTRLGMLAGTNNIADATNGMYFEVIGSTVVAKTASSSVRSTSSSYSLSIDVYHFRITYMVTSVLYEIYNSTGTLLFTTTLTTNIPTVTLNAGLITTNSGTTARTLVDVDYIGITIPPLNRGALT